MIPFGGAYEDVGADDTAFGGPRSGYGVYAIGLTETPEQLPAERDWVRSFWQALQPHASGIGTYVNTMVELDEDRIRASYGPKHVREARRDQTSIRPGQPLPPQRQHQAGRVAADRRV